MLIKSILASLALLTSSVSALAQQTEPEALYFNSANQCLPREQLKEILEERYDQEPFVIGLGAVKSATNFQVYQGLMLMYANPKTKSYTIIIYFEEDDVSCVLISGDQFQPAIRDQSI